MRERDTYTLIHAHGELSDVVVVVRGACVFFGSYPTGIRSIVRAVAEATKTDEEAADSFLALYGEKRLEHGI
jgi:cell division ATPase FtsA